MIYTDDCYKYRADKESVTILLPQINWFDKVIWKIKGYKITELPIEPMKKEN
jgi:virulence-associated protein VapD